MNTITKIILLFVLQVACIKGLFAQLPCEQKKQIEHKFVEYRVPQSNAVTFEEPTIHSFHSKVASYQGEIIKPVEAVKYNPLTGSSVENPLIKYNYFYDTTGKLVKEIEELLVSKEIGITTYSNKFIGNNIDTSTLYKSANMEPVSRYYYEYEIEQAEPYIARVTQQWNKSKDRWDNKQKTSYTYLDTTSWYVLVWELYDSGPDNSFRLYYRETDSLIYDENNNISHVVSQATDLSSSAKMLYEYFYPVDAYDNMIGYDSLYYYWEGSDDNPWIVKGKQTGFTWNRWDGFDYESNQMASFYGWYVNEDEGWDLWGLQKYWYDVDGIAGSQTDTVYFYNNLYDWYTRAAWSLTYNEQRDLCEDRYIEWEDIDLTGGVLEEAWREIHSYVNEYNDDGLHWRYTWYYTSLQLGYEDYLFYIWEVTEFADVTIVDISELPPSKKQLLSIAPNPASGMVTISATAEIAQLQIFDITGRLVNSQSPENRQVVFDTGVLPKGVYLVQVRLRNGGVQMGKIVVW